MEGVEKERRKVGGKVRGLGREIEGRLGSAKRRQLRIKLEEKDGSDSS